MPPAEKLLVNEKADFPDDDILSFPLNGFAGIAPSKESPLLAFDVDESLVFVSVVDLLGDAVLVVKDGVVVFVEVEFPDPESNEEKSNFNPVLIWLILGRPKNGFIEETKDIRS